jgi:hypothetical protein
MYGLWEIGEKQREGGRNGEREKQRSGGGREGEKEREKPDLSPPLSIPKYQVIL